MKNTVMFCVLLSQSFGSAACPGDVSQHRSPNSAPGTGTQRVTKRDWKAATYRGLTVGKATRSDMLRVLGEPNWSGPPGDQRPGDPKPEEWNEYRGEGEFPGKLTVVVDKDTGIILRIDLDPQDDLTKEEAIKHFGDDYVVTRYDFDECLSDGESAPMYESASGQFLSIEYRARGIALAIDQPGRVQYISYVKGPIGAESSKCKQR